METVAGKARRSGGPPDAAGTDPAGTDPAGTDPAGTNLVGDAIAELYAGDPDVFVERRRDLASRARTVGDRQAAKTIAGLGKPTRSAWIVNNLVRADPSVAVSLGELGGKLRSGEAALDGASIRELSMQRRELVDSLVRRAMDEAGQGSPSVALRDEVTDTFNAAVADPDVAEQVAAGTLLKAVHWAGFGPSIGSAISSGPARPPAARTREADAAAGRPAGRAGATGARARTTKAKASDATPPDRRAHAAQVSSEEQEAARLAEEAKAERDRHERREIIARAEEAAAEASRTADASAAAEREISDSVTFMQERLNREQQRLVQARRDTRQAAAAATRAKQTLERIRRQFS
jgi:hypothetical protein